MTENVSPNKGAALKDSMTINPIKQIAQILNMQTYNSKEFSFDGPVQLAAPGLSVKRFGPVYFPLKRSQVDRITGEDGVAQRSLCNGVWFVQASDINISRSYFTKGVENLTERITQRLGCIGNRLELHLTKWLIYEPGAKVMKRRDAPTHERAFGFLMIDMTSEHKGGKMTVYRQADKRELNFGGDSGLSIFINYFGFFLAECDYEMEPISTGFRSALVYEVCWPINQVHRMLSGESSSTAEKIVSMLLKINQMPHNYIIFYLDQPYTLESIQKLGSKMLNTRDRKLLNDLIAADMLLPFKDKFHFLLSTTAETDTKCHGHLLWYKLEDGRAFKLQPRLNLEEVENICSQDDPKQLNKGLRCILLMWPTNPSLDLSIKFIGWIETFEDVLNRGANSENLNVLLERYKVFVERKSEECFGILEDENNGHTIMPQVLNYIVKKELSQLFELYFELFKMVFMHTLYTKLNEGRNSIFKSLAILMKAPKEVWQAAENHLIRALWMCESPTRKVLILIKCAKEMYVEKSIYRVLLDSVLDNLYTDDLNCEKTIKLLWKLILQESNDEWSKSRIRTLRDICLTRMTVVKYDYVTDLIVKHMLETSLMHQELLKPLLERRLTWLREKLEEYPELINLPFEKYPELVEFIESNYWLYSYPIQNVDEGVDFITEAGAVLDYMELDIRDTEIRMKKTSLLFQRVDAKEQLVNEIRMLELRCTDIDS